MGDLMPYRRYKRTDARRYYAHAVQSIGRRGVIFVALGVLWLMQAAAVTVTVTAINIDAPARTAYLVTAAVWALSGTAGIAGSARPQGWDRLSTIGLYVAPAAGVVIGGIRVGLWIAPDWMIGPADTVGSPVGLIEIVGYGCLAVIVLALAGWKENLPHGRDSP